MKIGSFMKRLNIRGKIIPFVFSVMAVLIPTILLLLSFPSPSSSEEIYRFERMWPTLQQPWYFLEFKMALDKSDYVYVFNERTKTIMKFSADGNFIYKWSTPDSGDGQIINSDLIMFTVDNEGFVYILDSQAGRIQKFTFDGHFVRHWGITVCPFEPGYDNQGDIIADDQGYIYASDRCAMSITKFTPDGQYVAAWGGIGNNDGQFQQLKAITIDKGLLYAGDRVTNSINIFTLDGQFVRKWSSAGVGDDNLLKLFSMKADKNGFLYVNADFGKILKYTLDGSLIDAWFKQDAPLAREILIDSKGYIYLNDYFGIVKLAGNGNIVARWESRGNENGKFDPPVGIAIDGSGYVYIADELNSRVQKFASDGQYITQWAAGFVMAIAADKSGYIYTADGIGGYIKKFTSDGTFIQQWEVPGAYADGYVYFPNPSKITIDNDGYVYIWLASRTQQNSIIVHKFTSEGSWVTSWEESGYPNSNPMRKKSIFNPLDSFGNYYLLNRDLNNFIEKYSNNDQLIAKFGGTGVVPGKFVGPYDLSVAPNDMIYVVDGGNNRIQVFRKVTTSSNNKAIVVAGGGPYPGNDLWDATQMSANFAYRTLTYQGYTKESIRYLSSNTQLDLDDNGVADDIAGDATNENLQAALAWASGAEDVLVYLVDHGGLDSFRMSGTQTLSATQLSAWLNTLQESITGKVIVIYDACNSGSFVNDLVPPSGKTRITIASTSPGESAYFVTQGSVSFSSYFWTHIFNGVNVKDAFELARDAMGYTTTYQHPLLQADMDGNGTANDSADLAALAATYIGNGTVIFGSAPVIGDIPPDRTITNTSTASLFVDNLTDTDGIARVWAVIRPPDYNQGGSGNPVQNLPTIDLMPGVSHQYEATYSAFNIPGTYQIAIYAMDRAGNTSVPRITTVSVNNPLRRRAILVAGGSQGDSLWPAIETSVKLAYDALKFQGYADDDLYLLSPASIPGVTKLPVLSTLGNLQYALTTWGAANTQDVALYMVGRGSGGVFKISDAETLSAADHLKGWLDNLQGTLPGVITVVYDAPLSGSFLPVLAPPPSGKHRIIMTSTGAARPVYFLSEGDISFSRFFWGEISKGADLRDAYVNAKKAMGFLTPGQTPLLDDNGDGLHDNRDGVIAMGYTLGFGIALAADDPLVGSVSDPETIAGQTTTTIWAKDVSTTGEIHSVWAVLTPPGSTPLNLSVPITQAQFVPLLYSSLNSRYEGTYNGALIAGQYEIAIYAIDTDGNASAPFATTLTQTVGPDRYEADDTPGQAKVLLVSDQNPGTGMPGYEKVQSHTFHAAGDQDWVKFHALAGQIYKISVKSPGPNCDPMISLYGTDGTGPLAAANDYGPGVEEYLEWTCPASGIYYARIRQAPGYENVSGTGTDYQLMLTIPAAPFTGYITGTITPAVPDAVITTNLPASALGLSDGQYCGFFMPHLAGGPFTLTVRASGYPDYTTSVTVSELTGDASLNIDLSPQALPLYGDFGTGAGIWKWHGGSWGQVTPNAPQAMAAVGSLWLYGNFGTGAGIWKWDGSNWSQVTPNAPTEMAAAGSLLYGNFGTGAGIWKWDGANWSQVTPNAPTAMTASGSLLYGNFGTGAGIWKWESSAWSQVTPNAPARMAVDAAN
jgi:hypothetical protein